MPIASAALVRGETKRPEQLGAARVTLDKAAKSFVDNTTTHEMYCVNRAMRWLKTEGGVVVTVTEGETTGLEAHSNFDKADIVAKWQRSIHMMSPYNFEDHLQVVEEATDVLDALWTVWSNDVAYTNMGVDTFWGVFLPTYQPRAY